MDIHQARAVALDPTPWPRAVVVLALDVFRRELDRLESHTAETARQRMLADFPTGARP